MLRELTCAHLVIAVPFAAATVLLLTGPARTARWISALAFVLTFLLALGALGDVGEAPGLLFVHPLAAHLTVLTAFVAMTTSWASLANGRSTFDWAPLDQRGGAGYALQQCQLGALLLALLADNAGVTWIAMEIATIAGVLVLGLARIASWKVLLIAGLGLVLALFGTALLSLAAVTALGPGFASLSWSHLLPAAGHYSGSLLDLAFAFLLIGYGTTAALVPLHTWLLDAEAEAPDAVAIVLGGSILNVALMIILRLRSLVAASGAAAEPNSAIMTLGLLSLMMAGVSLWRRRDLRHFLAVSTIGQSGVAAFAFGVGGPVATFGGVLHMTLHALTRASLWQCAMPAMARKGGGSNFIDLTGLLGSDRRLGIALAAALFSLAALPPFGLFSSAFLIVVETVRRAPLLTLPLGVGLVLVAFALLAPLQAFSVRAARGDSERRVELAALIPVWLQLAVVLVLGLAMPGPVVAWFKAIASSNG